MGQGNVQLNIPATPGAGAGPNKPNADGTPNASPTLVDPAPVLLAGKFKTPADLEKAYGELEKRLGQAPSPAATPAPKPLTAEIKGPDATTPTGTGGDLLSQAELTAFTNEVVSKGTLSPESMAALRAKGFPEGVVNSYVSGLKAQAENVMHNVTKWSGGEDRYAQISAWAGTALTPAQLAVYNKDVSSGDPTRVEMAVKSLALQYASIHGAPNAAPPQGQRVVAAGGPSTTGVQPFASRGEMLAAQRSSQYRDPSPANDAFREAVAARIAVTEF